jgi:alpha-tubulin suppressor-like RCC1 family protein
MVTAGRLVTITGKTRKRLHVTLEPLSSLNEFLLIPERVTGGAGGVFHTCVRLSSGRINCWGDNRGGQVGDGSCDWYQLSPATRVIELSKVSQLSAGGSHTCAVNTGGKVICWGRAADGQLGDGCGGPDCQDGYRPVEVNLPSRATSVALGFEHSCSLLDSGQVYCWGQNYSGQLGSGKDASEMPFTNLPIAVQGLSGKAVEVVAGGYHTCARLEDAKVYCWGDNRYGQLGDGTDIEQLTPTVPVEIHQQATGLAAGGYHSCATLEDASLHCWGRNKSGQLGDGTQIDRFRPVHVAGLKGKPATVALGQSHSCVLQTGGGRVDCWGSNAIGQLGLGTFTDSPTPRRVKGVGGVLAQLFTGGHHTCAVLQEDGSIRCWGQNFYGQLGDGNRRDRNKP